MEFYVPFSFISVFHRIWMTIHQIGSSAYGFHGLRRVSSLIWSVLVSNGLSLYMRQRTALMEFRIDSSLRMPIAPVQDHRGAYPVAPIMRSCS